MKIRRKKAPKSIYVVVLTFLVIVGCSSGMNEKEYPYEYLYKDLKFEMERVLPPVFPNHKINLKDFGAISDGETLNTQAFADAIEALSKKGGGTLVVPSGVWYTGPIVFKSNINLHLEKGALILFSSNFDLYPLVETSFEGLDTRRCQSPISGMGLENIAITGEGSINGSGQDWRPLKRDKVPEKFWNQKVKSGGVVLNDYMWFPTEGAKKAYALSDMNVPMVDLTEDEWLDIKGFLRPVMISFVNCKNILLEGVLFENSPAWNIHPLMCENLIVDNISVRNPGYSQNGDGLDIESCKNVIVVNSSFDVGDDAICIKSGKDEAGRRGIPTSNVLIDNCKVFQGHGGFVVGSEMSGGANNIVVSNCQFMGTDVGLRFKSKRGRGGIVENIYIKNINMFDIATEAFLFDLFYGGKSAVEALEDGDLTNPMLTDTHPVDETTPVFRNIYVENLVCRNARRAMHFNGLPEMNIENINVKNVSITAEIGAELSESKDVLFQNVNITPRKGAAFILKNVANFKGEDLIYPDHLKQVVEISGPNSNAIELPNSIDAEKVIRK